MLAVGHERLAARLHVDEAEVVLVVETRGPTHCEEVIGTLRSAGCTCVRLTFTGCRVPCPATYRGTVIDLPPSANDQAYLSWRLRALMIRVARRPM